MPLTLDDEPDLVVMSVYITSARRAYRIADGYRRRGIRVALGGLHVSSLPDEAAAHADTVFVGPGEDTWPAFLADLRRGEPAPRYVSQRRSLADAPPIRRDLIDRRRYLCPNSIVVSRGCPHHCDFCYKDAFYRGRRLVLHAGRRRRARRDRADARPPRVLPRRPPARQPALRGGAVRGHARHGPRVPGREHGRRDPPAGAPRARGGGRHAERVRRPGDDQRGEPRPPREAPERRPRLRRRRPPRPRPRDHGQRQLRVRAGRRPAGRVRPHGRLGGRRGDRDRDLPHHDPVSGDGPPRPDRRRGPDHRHRLGPLRHPPRGLPAALDDARRAGGGLPARVSRVLRVGLDPPWRGDAGDAPPAAPPRRLRRRLEALRAAVGRRHPHEGREPDAAAARGDARRLRPGPRARRRPASGLAGGFGEDDPAPGLESSPASGGAAPPGS